MRRAERWTDVLHDHIECRDSVGSYEEQSLRVRSRIDIADLASGYQSWFCHGCCVRFVKAHVVERKKLMKLKPTGAQRRDRALLSHQFSVSDNITTASIHPEAHLVSDRSTTSRRLSNLSKDRAEDLRGGK